MAKITSSSTSDIGSEDCDGMMNEGTGILRGCSRHEVHTRTIFRSCDDQSNSKMSALAKASVDGTRTLDSKSEDSGLLSMENIISNDDGSVARDDLRSDFDPEAEDSETNVHVIPDDLRSWIFGRTFTPLQPHLEDEIEESNFEEEDGEQHPKTCVPNSEGNLVPVLPSVDLGNSFKLKRHKDQIIRRSLTHHVAENCVTKVAEYALRSVEDALALRVVDTSFLSMICPWRRRRVCDSKAKEVLSS